MTAASTTTSRHDAFDGALRHSLSRALSRVPGELAAGFGAVMEIFAEAGDGSTAARARFPAAD